MPRWFYVFLNLDGAVAADVAHFVALVVVPEITEPGLEAVTYGAVTTVVNAGTAAANSLSIELLGIWDLSIAAIERDDAAVRRHLAALQVLALHLFILHCVALRCVALRCIASHSITTHDAFHSIPCCDLVRRVGVHRLPRGARPAHERGELIPSIPFHSIPFHSTPHPIRFDSVPSHTETTSGASSREDRSDRSSWRRHQRRKSRRRAMRRAFPGA
jgi:hypothetical protein